MHADPSAAATTELRHVAILGNPNTGKTSLFNALTGYRARVGNYAGVTVERKSGRLKGSAAGHPVEIVDLPGTYSLAARSADERVAIEVLLGQQAGEARPELVIVVLDASNLERNLYLMSQIMETGVPVAGVLNMIDTAEAVGIRVDAVRLSRQLGLPIFPTIASRGEGVEALRHYLAGSVRPAPVAFDGWPAPFTEAIAELRQKALDCGVPEAAASPALLQRALLDAGGVMAARLDELGREPLTPALDATRRALEAAGLRPATLEARVRYAWIRQRMEGVLTRQEQGGRSVSDRLDAVLLHRVAGPLLFALMMLVVFQSIYTWSGPLMDLIDGFFGAVGGVVKASMAPGPLADLLSDGVVAGVGGVIIFLPQILILFFFIALLEDCGYMARAAFIMDRLLSRCGLSGRSFIPMLSSFACAIPGIMATRTIEDSRDRLTTILVAPLMSCSARLPVYTVMIGAFVPATVLVPGLLGLQGFVLLCMYLVGIVAAVLVALLLKRTLLRGATPPLLMELPPYRRPNLKTVMHRMIERGREFVVRAGTVILAVSIIIWALTYYPRPASVAESVTTSFAEARALVEAMEEGDARTEALAELDAQEEGAVSGAYLRQSYLGRFGRTLEPVVTPLGWDWRLGMAVLASFPAREVVIATLGIIFDVSDADAESVDLRDRLQVATWPDGRRLFTLPVALGVMVFFALCAQCAATLAVIRRETNSWRWPLFAFAYMTALAYIGAFATYQVASWWVAP